MRKHNVCMTLGPQKGDKMDALRALNNYTSNTCNPFELQGHYCRKIRQDLIRWLTGEIRPLSKCGVYALAMEYATAFDLTCSHSIMFSDALKGKLA